MDDVLIRTTFSNAEIFNARTYRLLIDRNFAPSLAKSIANDPPLCRRVLGELMPSVTKPREPDLEVFA